jgi:hypothetical protein
MLLQLHIFIRLHIRAERFPNSPTTPSPDRYTKILKKTKPKNKFCILQYSTVHLPTQTTPMSNTDSKEPITEEMLIAFLESGYSNLFYGYGKKRVIESWIRFKKDYPSSAEEAGKGWEIVHKATNGAITIVQRLSDNEVLSVRDYIEFDFVGRKVSGHISHFTLCETILDIYLKEDLGTCYRLNDLPDRPGIGSKIRKAPLPVPLFVTEDGKEIFEYDNCYCVNIERWITLPWIRAVKSGMKENEKYFKSEEKATEYVKWNKPMLSLAEVMSVSEMQQVPNGIVPNSGVYSFPLYKMIDLASSKINK